MRTRFPFANVLHQSSDIATGRPDRRIDHKLGLFLEELSAIRWTVDNQVAILSSLLQTRDSVERAVTMELAKTEAVDRNQSATASQDVWDEPRISYASSPQHATITAMAEKALEAGRNGLLEPCGFGYMLAHDCIQDLKDKRDDFATMVGEAASLKDAVRLLSIVSITYPTRSSQECLLSTYHLSAPAFSNSPP